MSARLHSLSGLARLIVCTFAGLFITGASHACDLNIEPVTLDAIIDYDVYGFGDAAASVPIEVENTGTTACDIIFELVDQADAPSPFAMSGSGVSILADLPGDGSSAASTTNANGQTELTLAAGESRTLAIDFSVPQRISVPAGTYTTLLTLAVRTVGDAANLLETQGTLTLTSAPRAQVNIAGTDGVFGEDKYSDSISFSDPVPGDFRDVFLQTRSNATNTVSLRSRNGSRMLHEGRPDSAIHYTVYLDGMEIDLTSPVNLSDRPGTDLAGTSEPLRIEISELENVFAGDYEDRITIDIVAN